MRPFHKLRFSKLRKEVINDSADVLHNVLHCRCVLVTKISPAQNSHKFMILSVKPVASKVPAELTCQRPECIKAAHNSRPAMPALIALPKLQQSTGWTEVTLCFATWQLLI